MRAVNPRSENEGLAEAETARINCGVRFLTVGSRPHRQASREVGPSTAPAFAYNSRRLEGRKDDGHKGHAPGRPRHGPAPPSC